MSGFIYFIEGQPKNSADMIAEHGLGYALTAESVLKSPINLGASPSGKPGWLLVDKDRQATIRYKPAEQTWKRVRNLWVGFWNDDKPGPSDLLRPSVVAGYPLLLDDGNEWIIPLVRMYEHEGIPGSKLPHSRDLDDDGNWIRGEVIERYRHLVSLCEEFFDAWHAALVKAMDSNLADFVMDHQNPEKTAVTILSANYAVSDVEVAMLRLMQDEGDTAGQIMWNACDCRLALSWILEDKKKADSDGLTIDAGAADFVPDTLQPTLT